MSTRPCGFPAARFLFRVATVSANPPPSARRAPANDLPRLLADDASGAGPHVALGGGGGRDRRARLVRRFGIGPEAAVPHREIVDDRADDDGNADAARAPVVADLPLLEEPHRARDGAETKHAPARAQDRVDAVHGADGLEHDDLGLAGRRSIVIDTRRRGPFEEEGRATGGAPLVGEVTDLGAGHVGDRPGRSDSAEIGGGRRDAERSPVALRNRMSPSAPVVLNA